MGDLSRDFSRSEFACKCGCGFDTVDVELINVLQQLRGYYRKKITITSGNRCETHNLNTPGASKDSQHQCGKACDFIVDNIQATEVYDYLNKMYPTKYGIGLYNNPGRVHLDVRPYRARWTVL